jgi:hypothetical protein
MLQAINSLKIDHIFYILLVTKYDRHLKEIRFKRNRRGILLYYIHYLKPSQRFLCTFGLRFYSGSHWYDKPDP